MAERVPADQVTRVLAGWFRNRGSPEDLDAYQHMRRSVTWPTDADGIHAASAAQTTG